MRNSAVNFLYETVRKFPDKICAGDEYHRLTFRDFFSSAYAVAKILNEHRYFNQPVLVYMPKSVEAIISFAGTLMSGNIYVPIDANSPIARIRKIIDNLGPCTILTHKKFAAQISGLGITDTLSIYLEDIVRGRSADNIDAMIRECRECTDLIIDMDPCYVMYTSGSTGIPKGVVISHRGVVDYIEWALSVLGIENTDVIGNQAPLFFDNSTLDIYLSWSTGASLHLIPENLFMFPIKLLDYLEKHRVTFIFFVPSVLVSVSQLRALSPNRLPHLKKVVFAGEVMPTNHLAYWQTALPDKLYINLYGPTEITVDCTYFIVDRIYGPEESLPIGYPCRNSGIIILNEDDHEAKIGEKGELCVRGSSLALGYWKDKERTQKAFVQNPLQTNYLDPVYRTGDIVYRNEKGQIIFVGRKDLQIKHMGYRIELGEIEHAARLLPDISNCCVLYNKASREIILFYESQHEIPVARFMKDLSSRIPAYMLPRKFRHYQKLPLSPNGKIDRKGLSDVLG